VTANPIVVSLLLPLIRAWCDHVTLIPEDSNTKVLSSGTPRGLKGVIPL